MSRNRARACFIAAVFLYGTIGPVVRLVHAEPEVIALIRGVVGTAFIALVLAVRGRPLDAGALRANGGWLVGTGLCLGINWVALFAAYRYASVAVASVCNYTAPVIVVLLAPILFREEIGPFKLGCVIAALVGIVLVSGVIGSDPSAFDPTGIALGMLAAAAFVGIVICNRFVGEMDHLERVLVQLGTAALVALAYVLWENGGTVPLPVEPLSLAICLLLGVVHTGFAYILWFGAQSHLPLVEISLLGYIEPVMSVLLSAAVLGEPLTALGYVGAALVLGSAAACELKG